jgi:hypothetical protein
MVNSVDSVRTYPDVSPLVVRRPVKRLRESQPSNEDIRAAWLSSLGVLINLLCGSAFTLAAAFTSEFLFMTTFWHGLLLGALLYGVFVVVGGVCVDV